MKSRLPVLLACLLCAIAASGAADQGSAQLKLTGSATENFVPNRDVAVRDLGTLRGRDQFSVSWQMVTSSYPKPDYRRFVFNMTAPKDGSAIQGLLIDFDRAKEFALYQPRCVLNANEGCDIRSQGIDLDVKAKTIRFTNAKFLLKSAKPSFPTEIAVDGMLRY